MFRIIHLEEILITSELLLLCIVLPVCFNIISDCFA